MPIKKSLTYAKERELLCLKILSILNLPDDNSIILYELDNDTEKQKQILELSEEIKKYFVCGTIASLRDSKKAKRPYLNIVRNILRQQGYKFTNKNIVYTHENGSLVRTMKYIISKDE